MRGIRGATTVDSDSREEIWQRSKEMTEEILRRNNLSPQDIGAAIFSATEDVTAAFPASGARTLPGFESVPLFDARQMAVEGSLPLCIRVLILADTDKPQGEINHVYLRGAKKLRPDLAGDL